MKPKVYLETTIASYLTARPSRDLIIAAHQQQTHEWWDKRRTEFDLYVSQVVLDEAGAGDKTTAAERLALLKDIAVLDQGDRARQLAKELFSGVPLPPKAAVDALHSAIAVEGGMDYPLTWNCTHIANATLRGRIEAICRGQGYEPPIICTPDELLAE